MADIVAEAKAAEVKAAGFVKTEAAYIASKLPKSVTVPFKALVVGSAVIFVLTVALVLSHRASQKVEGLLGQSDVSNEVVLASVQGLKSIVVDQCKRPIVVVQSPAPAPVVVAKVRPSVKKAPKL